MKNQSCSGLQEMKPSNKPLQSIHQYLLARARRVTLGW